MGSDVSYGIWLYNHKSHDIEDVVAAAVLAEEAGWDGVFLSDSMWEGLSHPWALHSAIAARTERIKLGTWITPVPRYDPWELALMLATIDQISDGRVICGGGLGIPDEYETYGGTYEPKILGERYDESLDIIQGLWSEEVFSYEGKHYTVDEAEFPIKPVQEPRVPFVLACWWPNKGPIHRAARMDGLAPTYPANTVSGVGPQGEQADGDLVSQLEDLIAYYHSLTDDPGELILDRHPPEVSEEYYSAAEELGVTWYLDTHRNEGRGLEINEEEIRAGPPQWDR